MQAVDIVKINNKRIEYPPHETQEFMTLEEYDVLTKKLVKAYAGQARKLILNSDDAIANITHEIMLADWRWDNEHIGVESGKCFSRSSYRIECAKFAILTYLKRYKKKKVTCTYPIIEDEDLSFEEMIPDPNSKEPGDEITANEKSYNIKNKIDDLLKSDVLTDIEEACLRLYFYKDYTYQQIGQQIGVCRERVRQIINNSINKMRENYEKRPSQRKDRRIKSL